MLLLVSANVGFLCVVVAVVAALDAAQSHPRAPATAVLFLAGVVNEAFRHPSICGDNEHRTLRVNGYGRIVLTVNYVGHPLLQFPKDSNIF